MNTCKICKSAGDHPIYQAEEMMFGTRASYTYFQCRDCECLQISDIPTNIQALYPSNYYSNTYKLPKDHTQGPKNALRMIRNRAYIEQKSDLFSKLLLKAYPFYEECPDYLLRLRVPADAKILDVGCGNGLFLLTLRNLGFKNLTGVDPYSKSSKVFPNGVRILKQDIQKLDGEYDLIILNHSFEHLPDPDTALRQIKERLSNNGVCVVRIPTASSFAWEHYRTKWVQLDAPRHFYLHSYKSIELLAERTGFEISHKKCDSTEFQFWGSEQYIRGIHHTSESSRAINPAADMFTDEQIQEYKRRAAVLNEQMRGDSIQLLLRPSSRSVHIAEEKSVKPSSSMQSIRNQPKIRRSSPSKAASLATGGQASS